MRGFFNLVPKSIDEDRWKGYACSRFDVVTHIVSVVPASYREAVATLLASPYLTTKTSQISMVGHPMFTFHS
jgi:hypothetical protein